MAESDDAVDRIAAQAANMRLDDGPETPPSASRWSGLRLLINPFERFNQPAEPAAAEDARSVADESMATASPRAATGARLATAVPPHPIYNGRTMKYRRDYMLVRLAYLDACNSLIAQGIDIVPLPLSACIAPATKRRIARFEWNLALHQVTEQMWTEYFRQAQVSTFIDYAVVDAAMRQHRRMNTRLPEPQSRMSKLQADLDEILDEFNLAEVAYEHEQKRLVKYLTDALAPQQFKDRVVTELSLGQNRVYNEKVKRNKLQPKVKAVVGTVAEEVAAEVTVEGLVVPVVPPTKETSLLRQYRLVVARVDVGSLVVRRRSHHHVSSAARRATKSELAGTCNTQAKPKSCYERGTPGGALSAQRHRAPVHRVLTESGRTGQDCGTVAAVVDGVAVTALLLDSGADTSLVARGVVDELLKSKAGVQLESIPPKQLAPVGESAVTVTRVATLQEVVLTTSAGPLMLRNLACYVEEANPRMEVTVGRPVMKILGFSTDEMLVRARDTKQEWELGGTEKAGTGAEVEDTAMARVCRLQAAVLETTPLTTNDDVDRHETRTASPTMKKTLVDDVIAMLEKRFELAKKMGLRPGPAAKLKQIHRFRVDSFRLEFGQDPPVKVAPLVVRLKPDATPTKTHARRMSPNDRDFLDRHVAALLAAGLVYRNPRSR